MTGFDLFSIAAILLVTVAGGWPPFSRPGKAGTKGAFPLGQSFAAGVFLALSLLMMLPSAVHLWGRVAPHAPMPAGPFLAGCVFLALLFMEHREEELDRRAGGDGSRTGPAIPLIMTAMIAVPAFLLGTALGMSGTYRAVVILIAILAHKGSAGFALAVRMLRSSLSRGSAKALYAVFALATPAGIVVGSAIAPDLSGPEALAIRAAVFSAAAGVFLYMSTMHGLTRNPLVRECRGHPAFVAMLFGFFITALVRVAMGEAHHPGG